MDFSREGSVRLIELSILGVNGAYFEFLTRQKDTLKKCYNKYSKINYFLEFPGYYSFAQDWILHKKKLLSLYKYLRSNSLIGEDPDTLRCSIEGYFFTIAYSAFIEYLSEEYPGRKEAVDVPEKTHSTPFSAKVIPYKKISYEDYSELPNETSDYYDPQKSIEPADNTITDTLQFLASIKPEKRVPFWLMYLCRERPLPESDIAWLAGMNECSTGTIHKRISNALENNENKSFAVSSKFLGKLLGEKPNTVSKRIQRVFDEIKNSLDKKGPR